MHYIPFPELSSASNLPTFQERTEDIWPTAPCSDSEGETGQVQGFSPKWKCPNMGQIRARPEPDQSQIRARSEPDQSQTRARSEPDQSQIRARPEPDKSQIRARPEPNQAQILYGRACLPVLYPLPTPLPGSAGAPVVSLSDDPNCLCVLTW